MLMMLMLMSIRRRHGSGVFGNRLCGIDGPVLRGCFGASPPPVTRHRLYDDDSGNTLGHESWVWMLLFLLSVPWTTGVMVGVWLRELLLDTLGWTANWSGLSRSLLAVVSVCCSQRV